MVGYKEAIKLFPILPKQEPLANLKEKSERFFSIYGLQDCKIVNNNVLHNLI